MAFARKPINIAPDVIVPEPDYHVLPVSATAITYNPPADRLYAPVAGPVMPGHPVRGRGSRWVAGAVPYIGLRFRWGAGERRDNTVRSLKRSAWKRVIEDNVATEEHI